MRFLNGISVGKLVVAGGGLYLWKVFSEDKRPKKPLSLKKETEELRSQARRRTLELVPELPIVDLVGEKLIDALADVRETLSKEEDQAEFDSIVLLFENVIRSATPEIRDEVTHALCCLTDAFKDISSADTFEDLRMARQFFQCSAEDFFLQIKKADPLVRDYGNQLVDRFLSFVIGNDIEKKQTHKSSID